MQNTTEMNRPTWRLQDMDLPASFPAETLDPAQALQAAARFKKDYPRYRSIEDFLQGAAGFHLDAAAEAYIDLAMMIRDGTAKPFDGWVPELLATSSKSTINGLLRRTDKPGTIHISISAMPAMTAERLADYKHLHHKIREELIEIGVDPKARLVQRALGDDKPITPSEALLKDLKEDPASYESLREGHTLARLSAAALEGDGADIDCLPSDQVNMTYGEVDKTADIMPLSAVGINPGPHAELILPVLSGLLAENGLAPKVASGARIAGKLPWACTNLEEAKLVDAGSAIIFSDGGLFRDPATQATKMLSREIALHDYMLEHDNILELSKALADQGFTGSGDGRFTANDGRCAAYVSERSGNPCIYNKTDNGTYRLELALETAGAQFVELSEISSGAAMPVGRFVFEGEKWEQDYDGDRTGRPPVPHTLEAVRHFNFALSMFNSLHCVMGEQNEMPANIEEDITPGM